VPWRRALLLAIVPALMTVIVSALAFHLALYRNYDTAEPFGTAAVTAWVGMAMQMVFAFAMYTAAIAFVLSFFPQSLSAFRSVRRVLALDAVLILLAAFGLWHFCHQLGEIFTDRFHSVAFAGVDEPSLTGLPMPALVALANIIRSVFTRAAILALGVLMYRKLSKRWMVAALALLSACAMVAEEVRTPGEFALEIALALVTVACVLAFCVWFARSNYLAYVMVLAMGAVHDAMAELLHSGNPTLESQGFIVLAAVFLGLVWAVGPGMVRRDTANQSA
jgi:hypothetical protein